jgi:adenylate cyclase
MKYKNKRRWLIIRDYSIGWSLAFVFYIIIRGEGTQEEGSVQLELWKGIIVAFALGPIIGSISGYAQILTEERSNQPISIQKLLTLRFIYVLMFIVALVLAAYFMTSTFLDVKIGLIAFAFEPGSFSIYLYILIVDTFMAILRQINLLLGEKNLRKLLRGKFYTPREEERIFMFLDLKSSTTLAEQLGHVKYSKLIQDCFNDLGVVAEEEAEIYQYVGDEVILTWKIDEGLRDQNCLNAFYNFKKELNKKRDYYLDKYNCEPFFKAGLNAGNVMVTEIGKYKKEIAYHGDTINTAARIQGKCNELNQEFLISESLKNKLEGSKFNFDLQGSVALKGKESEVSIYSVLKNEISIDN